MTAGKESRPGRRIVGVYNANGGLVGELAYIVGKLRGRCHCALCDITHGANPLGKAEWKRLAARLPVPFAAVHLNEMDTVTARAMGGHSAPALVLVDGHEGAVIAGADELARCAASPAALDKLIREKLTTALGGPQVFV